MPERYDAIVIGGGVVGASTLFHLAEFGCTKSLLLERGQIASGGTGKSCAIVRTHYSVLSNTELAVRSLAMFRDLKAVLDDPEAESGFVKSGYLILAKEGETADHLVENLALQREHGSNTEQISIERALELHPLLDLTDVAAVGFEPDSGYADPHLTTASFVQAARARGAEVRTNELVDQILVHADEVRGVRVSSDEIGADLVICIVGPWTRDLIAPLGVDVPMANYRHTVITLRSRQPYRRDLPIVKDLTVDNKMYFRPESGMILVGTGDYGVPVEDPDDMDVQLDQDLVVLQAGQIAHRVPSFEGAEIVDSWFGPYDITPDWNPVIDAAPGIGGLYMAFGFSGHGFKLAPMVGREIAHIALHLPWDIDLSPYRVSRFVEGRQLTGVYGIGSIS